MKKKNSNIDGGWAWMVGLGVFISFFLLGGFFRSFGLLYSAFLDTFGQSASATSLLTGARSACTIIFGPMSTALSQRFTERKVVIIGAILISLGFCLSFFATSLVFLIGSLGVLPGIGATLLIGPSNVTMGKYFNKKRARAFTMTSCGGCLGVMIVPILLTFLMEEYSVRGALLILGALMLHLILTGAFQRPLPTDDTEENGIALENHKAPISRDSQKLNQVDNHEVELIAILEKKTNDALPSRDNVNDLTEIRCGTDQERDVSFSEPNRNLDNTVCVILTAATSRDDLAEVGIQTPSKKLRESENSQSYISGDIPEPKEFNELEIIGLMEDQDNVYTSGNCVIVSDTSTEPLGWPTKRNDSKPNKGVKNFLRELFDLSLIKNPLFLMILFSSSFSVIININQAVYLVPLIESRGISRLKAANLLSIMGGTDIAGRLIFGYLADRKPIRPHHVILLAALFGGIICCVTPSATGFYGFVVLCAVYGLFSSSPVLLVMPAVVSCLGISSLPKALGLLMFFHGIVASASPSLLGLIKDFSGSYDMIFPVLGSIQIAAGLVMFLEPLARRHAPTSDTDVKQ